MTDQFFGLTDTGKQRKNNEDTFIAQLTADNKFIIACVIDGVGGYAGGEIAAALAREAILSRLEKPSVQRSHQCSLTVSTQPVKKYCWKNKSSTDHHNMACVADIGYCGY